MSKSIMCFDLDGTLVNERGEIHPRDVEILSGPSSQTLFIPCSGRLLPAVRRLFARHNLFSTGLIPLPLVLQNGAALYAPGETPLSFRNFSKAYSRFLIDQILDLPEVTFLIFTENQVYGQWVTDFAQTLLLRFDLEVEPFHSAQNIQISKLMAISEDHELLMQVAQITNKSGIEQTYSLSTVLEISPASVDKGSGLRILLQELDLWGLELIVAGDGGNDLSLFDLTPYTYAPHTAPPMIKAQAAQVLNVSETGLLGPMLTYASRLY
jgi:HAD superfamily hydrolase (TIGR01484 family)